MTKKKCSVLIDLIKDKFKHGKEKHNNSKKLNEIKKVRQEDLRKANIMVFGRTKILREKKINCISQFLES